MLKYNFTLFEVPSRAREGDAGLPTEVGLVCHIVDEWGWVRREKIIAIASDES